MLGNGFASPVSCRTHTSFGDSIISLNNFNLHNSVSESRGSTISSSDSDMTEVSIFSIKKKRTLTRSLGEGEIMNRKTCKCIVF